MENLVSKSFLFLWFSAVYLLITPCLALADSPAAATLIHCKGQLYYSVDQGNTWQPVKRKKTFSQGVFLKTGPNSEAAVMLKDRSQIRMDADSILNIHSVGAEPNDKSSLKKSILNFLQGKLWVRNKRETNKPDINTPVISASIRGTEAAFEVSADGTSHITILEGRLLCANDFGRAEAERGQKISVFKNTPPRLTPLLNPEQAAQWLLLTPMIKGPGEKEIPLPAQQALTALMHNNIEKAFELAEQAAFENPRSASARVMLATCYQTKGKFEKGYEQALNAVEADNASVPALVRCVELLLGLDRLKQASDRINAFPGNQNDPVVVMLKGYIALMHYDYLKAEALFKTALEKQNDLSKAYLGLGLAQFKTGKTIQALKNMENASLMDPMAAYPHNYLGKALLETGERTQAMAELKRASQLDPNDPTPYLYLAAIQSDTFMPGAAIRSLDRAVELNNNRLMTRSRYLLDKDASIKNINTAWAFSQLGLYNRAEYMGDSAVWQDPASSSAYMFRAVRSIEADNISPATIGDSKRELLLKPVNANTYLTYSDYYSLMDKPDFKTTLSASAGNEDSAAGRVNFYGGCSQTAYAFDLLSSTTDGFTEGTGRDKISGILSVKHALSVGHELAAQIIGGTIDQEDTYPRQNGDLTPIDRDQDNNYYSLTAGYHFKHGTDSHLLCLFQGEKRSLDHYRFEQLNNKFIKDPDIEENLYSEISRDIRVGRFELTDLIRTRSHRLNFGVSFYNKNTDVEKMQTIVFSPDIYKNHLFSRNDDFDIRETRIYTRDLWHISPDVIIDLGLGWSGMDNIELDENRRRTDRNELLPHIGAIWDISRKHRLRAAWFKELDPDYLNGSLQPVEAAGFGRGLGTLPGTCNRTFAFGWDCTWNTDIFTRLEIYDYDISYPSLFTPIEPEPVFWDSEDRVGFSFVYEQLLTDQIGMSLACDIFEIRSDNPDTERLDSEIKAGINWVHPSGLTIKTNVWCVDQDDKKGYRLKGDSFVTGSIDIEKQFGKKKQAIFLRCENIADERYLYMVRNHLQSSQLTEQGRIFEIGCRFNF